MKFISTLVFFVLSATLTLSAQTTYTWIGGVSGEFTTASNWNPSRNTPATNDILVFNLANIDNANTAGNITVANVATQTIGELRFTLTGTSTRTLTFSGTPATLTTGLLNTTHTTGTFAFANGGTNILLNGNLTVATGGTFTNTGVGKIQVNTTGATIGGGSATLTFSNLELSNNVNATLSGLHNTTITGNLHLNDGSNLVLPIAGGATRNFTLGSASGSAGGTISGSGTVSSGTTNPPAIIIAAGGDVNVGTINFSGLPTTVPSNLSVNRIEIQRTNATLGLNANVAGSILFLADIRTSGSPIASGNITINGGNNLLLRLNGANAFNLANTTLATNLSYVSSNKLTYARSATAWTLTTIANTSSSVFLDVPELEMACSGTPVNITLSANGKLATTGYISFTRNNQTFTTNNNLILASNSNRTGSIGDLTNAGANSGNTVVGNATVERFIPSKAARKWSFVSSPVSQTLAAGWQQQIHITGANDSTTPCATHVGLGFDVTALNNPSVFTYNASLASPAPGRWVAATNTNATSTAAGTGFRMLIRGPRTGGCALLDGSSLIPSAVTLSSTGAISNAAKNLGSFSITYNNNLANNWVLVGNPYPSQISFSALQATNSSKINNTYAIYNPDNASGVYTYWDGTNFTGGAAIPNTTGNVLPSGSAFFVQSIGATDVSLDFTEAHKTASIATIYQRNNGNQKQVRVHYQTANNSQIDEVVVRYAANSSSNTNIVSMNSGTNYITALKEGKGMVVQTREENNLENDEVALNVVSTVNGTYKLNFSQYETLQQTTAIYLKDKYTNSLINLNSIGSEGYSFTTDKNNAQTAGADRFSLVFRSINPAVTTISNIKLFPNPATKQVTLQLPNTTTNEVYSVRITDISGKVQLQQKLAAGVQQLNINSLAAGNYVVEVMDSKGKRTVEKLVKQ